MMRSTWIALGALLLVSAGGCNDDDLATLTSDLVVDPESLDFGQVVLGLERELPVTVRNNGAAAARLTLALPDANYRFEASTDDDMLAPGGRMTVRVIYAPAAEGEHSSELSVDEAISVPVTGQGVRPALVLDPDPVDFGDVDVNSTGIQSVLLRNEGSFEFSVTALEVQGTDAMLFSNTSELDLPRTLPVLDPPDGFSAVLAFRPRAIGEFTATLQVSTDAPGQESVPLTLRGNGVAPAIRVDPDPPDLDFGTVPLESSADRTLTVHNDGNRPLTIQAPEMPMTTREGELTLDATLSFPLTIEPGENAPMVFTYAPLDRQSDDNLRTVLVTNDPLNPMVSVSFSGRAPSPMIRVGSVLISIMGNDAVSAEQEVPIDNLGDDPLTVTGIELVADEPGDDVECDAFSLVMPPALPLVVAADDRAEVTVRFEPPNPGLYGCGLRVQSDDPRESEVIARVEGNKQ